MSPRIVGGVFGLQTGDCANGISRGVTPSFLRGERLLLATARSAFTLLNRTLKPKTVWLPSFLCGSIRLAFLSTKSQIEFYGVNENLEIIDEKWIGRIRKGDVVVFIDYFGFRLWDFWAAEAIKRGARVIEDASQALVNTRFSDHADYIVFSPRKFVGVPDGGILIARERAQLPQVALAIAPEKWWLNAFRASNKRAQFDRHQSDDREWFGLYQKAEESAPVEPYAMSDLTRFLLHRIDWRAIAKRRRDNFLYLADALGKIAIFHKLPRSVVPLGFPVRIPDRERIRAKLFTHGIFPPVHWPIKGIVPRAFTSSHRLANEIMTISCDQRYDFSDLERIVKLISV